MKPPQIASVIEASIKVFVFAFTIDFSCSLDFYLFVSVFIKSCSSVFCFKYKIKFKKSMVCSKAIVRRAMTMTPSYWVKPITRLYPTAKNTLNQCFWKVDRL